jgi:hypothetical protein
MAVGTGPATTIIMITALSRAPARPAGKPARSTGALDELLAVGQEIGRNPVSAAAAKAGHWLRIRCAG